MPVTGDCPHVHHVSKICVRRESGRGGACAVNSLVLPGSHLTDTLQLSVAINMAIGNMCLVLLLGSPVFQSPKDFQGIYLLFDSDKTP